MAFSRCEILWSGLRKIKLSKTWRGLHGKILLLLGPFVNNRGGRLISVREENRFFIGRWPVVKGYEIMNTTVSANNTKLWETNRPSLEQQRIKVKFNHPIDSSAELLWLSTDYIIKTYWWVFIQIVIWMRLQKNDHVCNHWPVMKFK